MLTARDLTSIPHREFLHAGLLGAKGIQSVSTDTRNLEAGGLFVALRGERFDGHKFLEQAFHKGAVAAVVDTRFARVPEVSKPLLVVEDTLRALGDLARLHRMRYSIPILAIGGSNGKTTTKEMVIAVLQSRFSVLGTEGNLNNQIGVPHTLFRLNARHDVAVLELGTNHPGEIAYLCGIVRPTHVLLTNIGNEHLEFFSTVDGVAREEGALFVPVRGARGVTGIVNADDRRVAAQARRASRRITYGFTNTRVRVRGAALQVDGRGCASFTFRDTTKARALAVQLGIPGRHNAMNALAAAAAGIALRVPPVRIKIALEQFSAVCKRMEALNIGGVHVVNDTYNANPDSMLVALETLGEVRTEGKRIAVLADMLELGPQSEEQHRRVGEWVTRAQVDCLLTFGDQAKRIHDTARTAFAVHYDQKNILAEYLAELVTPGDVVLVKGSRGMKMEDVVVFLQQRRKE